MTSTWIQRAGVYAGSTCTAQGVIKHLSDVGIATWTFVIAVHTFLTLWRSPRSKSIDYEFRGYSISHDALIKWLTTLAAWLFIFIIVILGSVAADPNLRGDFYGVTGDWCWITDGYRAERVLLAYLIMFSSAICSSILYGAVYYRLRRKLREKRESSNTEMPDKEQVNEYRMMLSKHTAIYPIAYFLCILPISIVRFSSSMSDSVNYGAFIFGDFVYLLIGIVNVVLFLCAPRILPPRTYLPKWILQFSMPSYDQNTKGASDYDDPYYSNENKTSSLPSRPVSLGISVPVVSTPKAIHAPENPYATPLYFLERRLNQSPTSVPALLSPRRIGLPSRPDFRIHPAAMDRRMSSRRSPSWASAASTAPVNKPLPLAPPKRPTKLPLRLSPWRISHGGDHTARSGSPTLRGRTHLRSASVPHAQSVRHTSSDASRSLSPGESHHDHPSSWISESGPSTSFSWVYDFRMNEAAPPVPSGSTIRTPGREPEDIAFIHQEIDQLQEELREENLSITHTSQYSSPLSDDRSEGGRSSQDSLQMDTRSRSHTPRHSGAEPLFEGRMLYASPTQMDH